MKNSGKKGWVLIVTLIAGALIGSVIWLLLSKILPNAWNVAFVIGSTASPWVVDLHVISLALGLKLSINPGSVVGMITALIVFFWKK